MVDTHCQVFYLNWEHFNVEYSSCFFGGGGGLRGSIDVFTHVCTCMSTPDICVCASLNFNIVLHILTRVCATTFWWETPQAGLFFLPYLFPRLSSSDTFSISFAILVSIPIFLLLHHCFVRPYFFFSFILTPYYSPLLFSSFSLSCFLPFIPLSFTGILLLSKVFFLDSPLLSCKRFLLTSFILSPLHLSRAFFLHF